MKNKNKILIFIIILVAGVILASIFILNKNAPTPNNKQAQEVKLKLEVEEKDLAQLNEAQKKLFEDLKTAAQKEDYENFAKTLKEIYKNQWEGLKPFQAIESALYVLATDKYFQTKNYEKSLEVSTIVYSAVPLGWRFRYLKILSHEKLGRLALQKNNLAEAEKQALAILSMMYRIEGADLLGDIYIKKIRDALTKKDKKSAQDALAFIWDYEVSQDRRKILNDLKDQISKL